MPKAGCIKNQFIQGGNGLDFVDEIGGGIKIYIIKVFLYFCMCKNHTCIAYVNQHSIHVTFFPVCAYIKQLRYNVRCSHSKLWRLPGDDSGIWPGTVGKNPGKAGKVPRHIKVVLFHP